MSRDGVVRGGVKGEEAGGAVNDTGLNDRLVCVSVMDG